MVLDFYGLAESPFSLTPDPRFVFLSDRHREALAHLVYGIGQGGAGGFVQLTGEVGTGKTTLSRLLLEQLPDHVRPALILNPLLSPLELVEAIAEEIGIDISAVRGSRKGVVDALNRALLAAHAAGQGVVVIIDEAQNLSDAALEEVRLLTNLETARQKLLQIILIGQPELRDKLARPELRQLAQRITARYHLAPLDADEVEAYLRHRFAVAGGKRFPFAPDAVRALSRHSGGVPRLLNILADRALLAGYVADAATIGRAMVDHAAREVRASAPDAAGRRPRWALAGTVGAVGVLLALGLVLLERTVRVDRADPAVVATGPAPLGDPVASGAPNPPSIPDPAPPAIPDALASVLAAPESDAADRVWRSLLGRWDAVAVDGAIAARCPARIRAGLRCTRIATSLERLAQLDRPVLLLLRAGESEVPAQLVGWRGARVLLDPGVGLVEVEADALATVWSGAALALWRESEPLPGLVAEGDRGPAVAWVHRRLERFDRLPGASGPDAPFDAATAAAVRALQAEFGLVVDGIVGPETQWLLSTREAGGPRLTRLPE
jgi:general secretion pathway protein A